MDQSLVETYGGWANLFLTITGSIVVVLFCIYYLNKEFMKMEVTNDNTQIIENKP